MVLTYQMDVSVLLDLEYSSWLERMAGLMYGTTTIDRMKLHSLIKSVILLSPASRSIIISTIIPSQESIVPSEIKMVLSLS